MSAAPSPSPWGPGLIGLTIGAALSGAAVGQFIYYLQAFPHDMIHIKGLVFAVFTFDTANTFTLIFLYHHILIACRSNDSPACVIYLSPLMTVAAAGTYGITFLVQSFYAHRVWIISGQNRLVTSAVFLSALAQLVFGVLCISDLIRSPTYEVLTTSEFSAMSAIASAVCDAIITTFIIYYLRVARAGITRMKGNYLKKLNAVFVQMGLFCCINALAVAILYGIQQRDPQAAELTAAPGILLCKAYTNSMLSVLNARKGIRDEQEAQDEVSIEIPTIRMI